MVSKEIQPKQIQLASEQLDYDPVRRAILMTLLATVFVGLAEASTVGKRILPTESADILSERQLIDGLETFGSKEALKQGELRSLINQLNSQDKKKESRAFTATVFVQETVYKNFLEKHGESFPLFITRHSEEFDKMLKNAPRPHSEGFQSLRLIVVRDDVDVSPHANGVTDSNGSWFFQKDYDPTKSSYYDSEDGIDYEIFHEWGHNILNLPDAYALDFPFVNGVVAEYKYPQCMSDISHEWRNYIVGNTPSNSIMAYPFPYGYRDTGKTLGVHPSLQIGRRQSVGGIQKSLHERGRAFPNEIPNLTKIDVGKRFAGSKIEIYRSKRDGSYDDQLSTGEVIKTFTDEPIISTIIGSEGVFEINDPFPTNSQGMVSGHEGLLLMKIYGRNDQLHFRYIDIRAFNEAYWLGFKEQVKMTVMMSSNKIKPENFNWYVLFNHS